MANAKKSKAAEASQDGDRILSLALLASFVGLIAGVIGALFRLALERADAFRDTVISWAHGQHFLGFIIVVAACMAATATAAWMVRRIAPVAAGSGIPHVEAVLEGEIAPAPLSLLPVKFIGGVLAIGSGLALGREGPSIQMAASVATIVGRSFRRTRADCRELIAGAAGAGLATAFNAPLAGAVFVLEELVGRFEPRIAIVALGASASAIAVSRLIIGDTLDFSVPHFAPGGTGLLPVYLLFGLAVGGLSIVYNRSLLAVVALSERFGQWPELRAATIGACVGAVAWYTPSLVGGGDVLIQRALMGSDAIALLPVFFLLRLALGAISYTAATPGGLLAPVLALGALAGLFFGLVGQQVFPDLGIQPEAFVIVGMTALFVGVVRAPLTAIALVTEMTGSTELLLPMLAASFGAMVVPTMLGNQPIYLSLHHRLIRTLKGPGT